MIDEDRFKDLINHCGVVYDEDGNKIKLDNAEFCCIQDKPYAKHAYNEFYGDQVCFAEDVYETIEEVNFINSFYCSKTIYFKPPTYELFMKTKKYEFHNQCMICGYNTMPYFTVENDNHIEQFYFNENNKKQVYYEAVEYAKKMFLGVE